jgi:hypothetical protein
MRTNEARAGHSAGSACHRVLARIRHVLPSIPEVGAVCGKAARTDLCGGREVTRVPTAKVAHFRCWHLADVEPETGDVCLVE